MGLTIENKDSSVKTMICDLPEGTIALLEGDVLVIAVDDCKLGHCDAPGVHAIALETGCSVTEPDFQVKKVFQEGEKITMRVTGSPF